MSLFEFQYYYLSKIAAKFREKLSKTQEFFFALNVILSVRRKYGVCFVYHFV